MLKTASFNMSHHWDIINTYKHEFGRPISSLKAKPKLKSKQKHTDIQLDPKDSIIKD